MVATLPKRSLRPPTMPNMWMGAYVVACAGMPSAGYDTALCWPGDPYQTRQQLRAVVVTGAHPVLATIIAGQYSLSVLSVPFLCIS